MARTRHKKTSVLATGHAQSKVAKIRTFQKILRDYYKKHGRHHLPWRNLPAGRQEHQDPYRILVSEVMLQQTQVDRVVPFYKNFLKQFPRVEALAEAPLSDVLRAWQGLGYNRRAKMLHEAAKVVVEKYNGTFPRTYEELVRLPGVGQYTAKAVRTFAYNEKEFLIETNVRSVFIYHFFPKKNTVSDTEILKLVEETFPKRTDPRAWYAALMDYGSYLKKLYPNPSRKSKHHTKQTAFKGSNREIRGAILRAKLHDEPLSKLPFDKEKVKEQYTAMKREGLFAT